MRCEVAEGAKAADRLAELGLKPSILDDALRGAEAEARTYTELDPPNMAGMARWARTIRLLREHLVPLGWGYDNPRNLSRTLSPDRRVAIIATLGDEGTGRPGAMPSTRYEKGVATIDAVNRNFVQLGLPLDLDDEEGPIVEPDGGVATWVLLYHRTEHEIRAELSLPDSIVDGRIDTWLERIILAPVPLEQQPELSSEYLFPVGDLEVPVARRSTS
jgi:hypothetical protein